MQLTKKEWQPSDKDNPWAVDKLERRAVAKYLTPVIASITQPFTIAINSPYGTGKSLFLNCWKNDLEKRGFHVVLFNAWETDFSQDAMIAFISAIQRELEKSGKIPNKEKAKELFTEFAKAAGGFMRRDLLPMIGRVLTRKALGDEEAQKLLDNLSLEPSDVEALAASFATEAFQTQQAAEEALTKFKAYLSDVVAALAEETKEKGKVEGKLIIFVDELDRCRPNYAIQLLEAIKHLFSVPGLVFIIATDHKQISNAVASVYGPNVDADGYLRRFFDWRFSLPKPSHKQYLNFLVERFELKKTGYFLDNQKLYNSLEDFVSLFSIFSNAAGFSLRQIEQCFTEINLSIRSIDKNHNPMIVVTGLVSILMSWKPNFLEECFRLKIPPDEKISELLDKVEWNKAGAYSDRERSKKAITIWFLIERDIKTYMQERASISDQYNKLSSDYVAQEKLRPRLEFLGSIIGLYENEKFSCNIYETSLAKQCYDRLIGAHKYLQRE